MAHVLSNRLTVLNSSFVVTRSGLPSRLKSPTPTRTGSFPVMYSSLAPKVPSPRPGKKIVERDILARVVDADREAA